LYGIDGRGLTPNPQRGWIVTHPHKDHVPEKGAIYTSPTFYGTEIFKDMRVSFGKIRDKQGKLLLSVYFGHAKDISRVINKDLETFHSSWVYITLVYKISRREYKEFRGIAVGDLNIQEVPIILEVQKALELDFWILPSYGKIDIEQAEDTHGLVEEDDPYALRDRVTEVANKLKETGTYLVSLDHKGGKPEWADMHLPIITKRKSDD